MSDRLFPAPADPATLTDRQRIALEYVSLWPEGVEPFKVGCQIAGYSWAKQAGLSVLRELHQKGLVRRVGQGGGRWTLSGEDARTGSHKGTAAPPSPPGQTDTIPY